MKQRIAILAVMVGLLGLVAVTPLEAAPAVPQTTVQHNGAGGLVAATVGLVAQLNNTTAQVGLVNLNRSLNNLTALNNVLNNNNVLDNNNVPITVQNVSVLSPTQIAILNNSLNNVNALVGVAVLSTGQMIGFVSGK